MKRKLIWLSTSHKSPFNNLEHEQLVACANGERFQVSKAANETQWHAMDDPVKYDEIEDAMLACQVRSDVKSLELDPSDSEWLSPAQIEADLQLMEVQWGPVSRSHAILCDGAWSYSCEEYEWVGERANDLVEHVCKECREMVRDRVRQILLGSRFKLELDEKWCGSREELERHVVAFEQRWNSATADDYEEFLEDKSNLYDLTSPVDLPYVMDRVGAVVRDMFLR